MIQEYMSGNEYGVDVYVDMISKEIIQFLLRKNY